MDQTRARQIAKETVETLIAITRGSEGLDIPPKGKALLVKIINRIRMRLEARQFPAITSQELQAIHKISLLPPA